MAEITNVNLAFLRKVRGLAALSRYALRDDGSLLISAPDEMEVRAFHLVEFNASGRSRMIESYSVETLRRTEIDPAGAAYLGTTDDDLYLFLGGRKSRFLPDRRASYADVALAQSGGRFAAAFCDLLQSGHTVALGETSGRLLWTKDVPFPVARVAVDRDGKYMAVAGESGDLLLLDGTRQTRINHRQEVPLLAVATIGPQRTVFACGGGDVAEGGVGAIDDEGALQWYTPLVGTPLEVGLSADGTTIAVLSQIDATSGRLVFLSGDGGMPTWDIDFDEARPTGLSIAPGGGYAAVSLRDGSLSVFELHHGERVATLSEENALAEARAAADAGSLRGAIELLQTRLAAVPSDIRACALLAELLATFATRCRSAAANAAALGEFAEADSRLADAISLLPLDAALVQERHALRAQWSATALADGRRALEAGDGASAETALLAAIVADPLSLAAREALAEARGTAADTALDQGRTLLAAGSPTEALVALAEARRRGASGPLVNEMMRAARVAEALELGNRLYRDRQYAAALFQFKKVLRLEPDHPEALQKVGYAQNFLQDTQLSDRFTRLE
jgi:tetratricopeptide (TPR) repeat protein